MRALHRCLLWLYPPDIRRDLGDEMEQVFLHCSAVERARRPGLGPVIAAGRGVIDGLLFAWSFRHATKRRPMEREFSRRRFMPLKAHDLRVALRRMRQRPLGALAIVMMLALGIGASTAMFSVIYGVLLAPLPFPSADRLVQIWGSRPDRGWDQVTLTEANFWDLRDLSRTFEEFGAWHTASATLTDGGSPEQVSAALVSSGFFRSLGVAPVAGRLFESPDDALGSPRVALLSHELWVRRYGSDAAIVGKPIQLGSGPRTVVGVLPAGTPWLDSAELFVPFQRRTDADRESFEYIAIGRLKPGVTLDTALADLQAASKELEQRYPQANTGLGVTLVPAERWLVSDTLRRTLWILLGAVGLLLVIACVNVTNLLLARSSARVRESAVRTALGASRGALVREWLSESLVLSLVAAGVGLLFAQGLLQAMRSFNPGEIPRLDTVALNGWVFAFESLLAVIVGLATGLVPALQAPLANVITVLRSGQRGTVGDRRHHRLRSFFVAAEVALSLMLLVGAGLLVRSLTTVLSLERGFQTDNRLFANVSIPSAFGPPRIAQISKEILTRLEAHPDVVSVAAVSGRLLAGGGTGLGLAAADKPDEAGAAVPWGSWRIVTPGYFKTIGLPLLKDGRSSTPTRSASHGASS